MVSGIGKGAKITINRPMSVTVISIFCWLFSVASGLVGFFSFVDLIYSNKPDNDESFYSPLLLAIAGPGLSILYFSTGTGLWRLKQQSRTAAIIICSLIILTSLVALALSIAKGQLTDVTIAVLHGLALFPVLSTKVRLAFSSQ